jgi:hypothetical protein
VGFMIDGVYYEMCLRLAPAPAGAKRKQSSAS